MIESVKLQDLTDAGLLRALNILCDLSIEDPKNDALFNRLVRFETEAASRGLIVV